MNAANLSPSPSPSPSPILLLRKMRTKKEYNKSGTSTQGIRMDLRKETCTKPTNSNITHVCKHIPFCGEPKKKKKKKKAPPFLLKDGAFVVILAKRSGSFEYFPQTCDMHTSAHTYVNKYAFI
ncbi:hypothetical protein POVWA1_014360 [Plasmodium ovale wallikeri]|uniref:Uncharacterized protein n=1 Tax=Plasmodium ovale wallikeri TaxID=864142 RepID=A0A1A8YMS6_PLAOA|nr:hypothetical protein POVWA1_014360 [Plasmodium ovale wallikeri]